MPDTNSTRPADKPATPEPIIGTGEWREHPCDKNVPADECSTSEMLRRCATLIEKSAVPSDYDAAGWAAILRARAEVIEPKFVTYADKPGAPSMSDQRRIDCHCGVCGGNLESTKLPVFVMGRSSRCVECGRVWVIAPDDDRRLKADALPAPAGELERLRAELAAKERNLEMYRETIGGYEKQLGVPARADSIGDGIEKLNKLIDANLDTILGLVPSDMRQHSLGVVDCVKRLRADWDRLLQENHLMRHGHKEAEADECRATIASLEKRATAAEAELAKYQKVIVGDNITRLPKGCYAYQKQDWAAWGVKLVDRDDEIADRGWNFIRLPDAATPGPQRGPASVAQIQAQSKQAEREVRG